MTKYSKEIVGFVKNNAIGKTNQEITELVNNHFGLSITINQMKSFKSNHKISSGLTGYFVKGHSTHNKGKCWNDYLSKKAQSKIRETCFTKGKNINNQRHKWCEVGEEKITKYGYIMVRVAERTGNKSNPFWQPKQRLIYEKHNGKVPKGSVIIFADGNIRNFDIDNLVCVSRQELLTMNQNSLIKKYGEATKSGLLIAKLYIKMNKLKKWRNNGK